MTLVLLITPTSVRYYSAPSATFLWPPLQRGRLAVVEGRGRPRRLRPGRFQRAAQATDAVERTEAHQSSCRQFESFFGSFIHPHRAAGTNELQKRRDLTSRPFAFRPRKLRRSRVPQPSTGIERAHSPCERKPRAYARTPDETGQTPRTLWLPWCRVGWSACPPMTTPR